MYFLTKGGSVYHILSDERAGAASCGARMDKLTLMRLHDGKPTPRVVAEKPDDAPLCKHCEKRKENWPGVESLLPDPSDRLTFRWARDFH